MESCIYDSTTTPLVLPYMDYYSSSATIQELIIQCYSLLYSWLFPSNLMYRWLSRVAQLISHENVTENFVLEHKPSNRRYRRPPLPPLRRHPSGMLTNSSYKYGPMGLFWPPSCSGRGTKAREEVEIKPPNPRSSKRPAPGGVEEVPARGGGVGSNEGWLWERRR